MNVVCWASDMKVVCQDMANIQNETDKSHPRSRESDQPEKTVLVMLNRLPKDRPTKVALVLFTLLCGFSRF